MNEKKYLLSAVNIKFPEEIKESFHHSKGMLLNEISQEECDELLNDEKKLQEILLAKNHPLHPALNMISQKLLNSFIKEEECEIVKNYWRYLEFYAHLRTDKFPSETLRKYELEMENFVEKLNPKYNQELFEKILIIGILHFEYCYEQTWFETLAQFYKSIYTKKSPRV